MRSALVCAYCGGFPQVFADESAEERQQAHRVITEHEQHCVHNPLVVEVMDLRATVTRGRAALGCNADARDENQKLREDNAVMRCELERLAPRFDRRFAERSAEELVQHAREAFDDLTHRQQADRIDSNNLRAENVKLRTDIARLEKWRDIGEGMVGPTWPYVLRFARIMEKKLSMNRHKGDREGWRNISSYTLLAKLQSELGELLDALQNNRPVEIAEECADVANFAMMIADRRLNLEKYEGVKFTDPTKEPSR